MRSTRQAVGGVPRPGGRLHRVALAAGISTGLVAMAVGLVAWTALSAATPSTLAIGLNQAASVVSCADPQPTAPAFVGTAGSAQSWVAAHPGPCWTIYYGPPTTTTTTTVPTTTTTYPKICRLHWYDHRRLCPKGA